MSREQAVLATIAQLEPEALAARKHANDLSYAVEVRGEKVNPKQLSEALAVAAELERRLKLQRDEFLPRARQDDQIARQEALSAASRAAVAEAITEHLPDLERAASKIERLKQELAAEVAEFKECRDAAIDCIRKAYGGAGHVPEKPVPPPVLLRFYADLGVHNLGPTDMIFRTGIGDAIRVSETLTTVAEHVKQELHNAAERFGVTE